jgi:regulator of sirC expression with transglutaminase-like and TPR domain
MAGLLDIPLIWQDAPDRSRGRAVVVEIGIMRRLEILSALENVGRQPDEMIDLAEVALLLAALDRPDTDLGPYRRHLATLASNLADLAIGQSDGLDVRAAALTQVISEQHGYIGDRRTYDDLQNASLLGVIDRRKGLPVALGILYIHAARAQGWRAVGINFPGHFLIAIEDEDERVILDPFEGGAQVDLPRLQLMLKTALGADAELQPEYYASMTNRGVLLRLQNNIKKRVLDAGDPQRGASVVDGMLAIAPELPDLWREAAELRAEIGELRSALMALDRLLVLADDSQRSEAMALRRNIATRIN